MTFQVNPVRDANPRTAEDSDHAVASPAWLLGVAALAVALGVVALLLKGLVPHLVGYALASLLPFTIVALYRKRSEERLDADGLPPSRQANTAAVLLLVAGFVCSIVHAWFIARLLT